MAGLKAVPAAGGAGLRLAAGERLRIVDTEGGQTGDLVAYAGDGSERLSNGRTFDYNEKIYLSAGDVLWSDRSRAMLTIVEDESGRHDMLYGACTREMYELQYAKPNHPNCHDNLSAALCEQGIEPVFLPTPFNLFMNVDVTEAGRLVFGPPRTRPGCAIVFRAEMDLVVAISACPASTCNGGAPPRTLSYEILAD